MSRNAYSSISNAHFTHHDPCWRKRPLSGPMSSAHAEESHHPPIRRIQMPHNASCLVHARPTRKPSITHSVPWLICSHLIPRTEAASVSAHPQPSLRVCLDATSLQHLLPQVVLVVADTAVPPGHRLVLAHHDVLGNLVEQSNTFISRAPSVE